QWGIVYKMYAGESKGKYPAMQVGVWYNAKGVYEVAGGVPIGEMSVGPCVRQIYPEYLTDPQIIFCPSDSSADRFSAMQSDPTGDLAGRPAPLKPSESCTGYMSWHGSACMRGIDASYGYS